MHIYLVVGATPSWRASGYMAAVQHGDAAQLLVSFVEFMKNPGQQLAVSGLPDPYVPNLKEKANERKDLDQS